MNLSCWLFGHLWHAPLVLRPDFWREPGIRVPTEADLVRLPERCMACGKERKPHRNETIAQSHNAGDGNG